MHSLRSPLSIALSLLILVALMPVQCLSLLQGVIAQKTADRTPRPRPGKPEGTWPDLEDVKNESSVEREAPPPIPSTVRAKRNEGKPWDGRRVGDPGTSQRPVDQPDEERQTRRAHARRRAEPPVLYEDQFIQNFFSLALLRSPTSDETLYWNYLLRAGYNQNQTSLKFAAIELGKTLFESASYAARNRDAHFYVYDLYKTYLMREPDAGGWAYWEAIVPSNGREYVRRGFEESGEFATLLATISLSGSASPNPSSLITARVDPRNQNGNGMLSRDVSWSVPLLSLPGRNGLNLGLSLSYSSMVWTHSGPYFYFDEDNGFPSPGFRLGFPTVQRKTFDAQTGKNAYLLITPAGHRAELRQTTTSTVYEAADSSYLQLTESGANLLVRSTDGTQLIFVEANNEYRCTQIKDRNGNYITVNYNAQGQLTTITDTLGRVITFNYDSNANLISITQAWNGQPSHQWVSFGWSTRNMQYSFVDATVIGIKNGNTVLLLTQVALNDTSYFTFDYTNSLQVSSIKNYFSGMERNATSFGYETPSGDVPRLTSSSVSGQNWTGVNGLPAQVTTQYSVAGDGACVMTAPHGTVYREYYGTGWQKGLTTLSEVWVGTARQKWTTTAWTQDNTAVSYETNPRVIETNVYDASGNRRRTTIDYGQYASWGLPYPSGDDAAGVYYTQQTYDWNGRPLVTTNTDGTTKEASYSGCGCAGGAVVTLTDEGTIDGGAAKRRQQRIYSDVFGRTVRTELLNWQNGSVYSTASNMYNARDQITLVRQYAGVEGSGTYQDTTFTYDGYGRLQARHVPEQNAGTATTWSYNTDDTIQSRIDARGASTTFTYNNGRHLPNVVTHTLAGASTIVESFSYDAVGNRVSMSDSSGSTTYQYDQLSHLTSETRTFSGLGGSYTLGYDYHIGGQLKSITDHTNQRINYAYNNAGRLNSLTGTNYTYGQFINNISYRAWGGPKQISYGNGRTESVTYNSRLRANHYEIPAGGGFAMTRINRLPVLCRRTFEVLS